MRNFLKAVFVFLYICFGFLLNQNEALANGVYISNTANVVSVSQQKNETAFTKGSENYFTIIQSRNNNTQIRNNSNKNNGLNSHRANENALLSSILYCTTYESITIPIRISHNTSLNLKNAVYARAP